MLGTSVFPGIVLILACLDFEFDFVSDVLFLSIL